MRSLALDHVVALQEEEQLEKEAKALENARFRKELELLAHEAAEDKLRRREGFRKEQERIHKVPSLAFDSRFALCVCPES